MLDRRAGRAARVDRSTLAGRWRRSWAEQDRDRASGWWIDGLRGIGPTLAFVAYLGAVAAWRFVALTDRGAPATVDAGNWLAFGNTLLGDALRPDELTYPPVIPLAMALLTRLTDATTAVGLLGAATSVAPAAGAYVTLRLVGLRWPAVLLAALLAPAASTGEAAAWGGFPQLLGTGLAVVFVAMVDRVLDDRLPDAQRWPTTLFAAAIGGMMLATSHFASVFATATCALLVVLHLAQVDGGQRAAWMRRRLAPVAVLAVPAVVMAPSYLPLLFAVQSSLPEETATAALGVGNLFEAIEFSYRDVPVLWRALVVAALAAPVVLRDQWRTSLWRLTVAAFAAVAVTSLLSGEARYLYFVLVAAVLGSGLWARELAGWRDPRWLAPVAAGALVLVLAVQTFGGLRYFGGQRDFYGIVSPELYEAMDWLRTETPPDTVLGVTTVDDAPLGWWFEGEVGRPTVYASPLRWLAFDDEIRRARVANEIFAPPFPDRASVELADRSGIDLLVVATQSRRYEPEEMEAFLEDNDHLVVFRNDGAIVLDPARLGRDEAGDGSSSAGVP